MKKFFTSILVMFVFSIGCACFGAVFLTQGLHWYHIPLFIGSMLITLPAITWWENYFKELFKNEE